MSVESRLGIKVEAEVIDEDATVRVQAKGDEVIAKHQLLVEMKYEIINMDSPLMVTYGKTLLGIMWGSGISPGRYSMGVVQPIESA